MVVGLESTLDQFNYCFNCTFMYSTFQLNSNEQISESLFKKEHDKHSSTYEYTFIPTAIGVKVRIKCRSCGKSKDITDYSSW